MCTADALTCRIDGARHAPVRAIELRGLAPGPWIWRTEHSHGKPTDNWQRIVAPTRVA